MREKKCMPCEGNIEKIDKQQAITMLENLPEWQLSEATNTIYKEFNFKGYYKTIAFVNAVAWLAHTEGHHPDLEVSYNKCVVKLTTHAINGLSNNDFILAELIENL